MNKLIIAVALVMTLAGGSLAADKVRIGLEFEANTTKGIYRDTLWWYSLNDYNNATKNATKIEEMKQARVDNWLSIMAQPSKEPTLEEYRQEAADKEAELQDLKQIIKEKEAKGTTE